QYHNRGRVDGIEGDVDLNVLQGGADKLAELFATRVSESTPPETPRSP
ncbi:lysozyme, partial [Mesorhizobium sp. M2E.F.Ca.ET.219.01.1.1]